MINKIGYALSCSAVLLYAESMDLGTIEVESVANEVVKDVHGEDIKSADLGEALFKKSSSVSLIRRSGIANDIRVRGQKKDNINVTIDGAKVHGACPNRMDPPISHVLSNNVEYIEINEGPFNIEDTGVLSADIKIHTIKPEKEFQGEVNLAAGSFGYQKATVNLSGGNENLGFLLSTSTEKSEAYKDGDGRDFVGQIAREIEQGNVPAGAQYQSQYQENDAYKKETLMGKLFWDITEHQALQLSYTANRSDEVLYPNTPMDALYDDSDIYTLNYTIKDLGNYAKALTFSLYQSEVDHPMTNRYRQSGAVNYTTHALTTKTNGIKVKNSFDVGKHALSVGVDYNVRNWDGKYYRNGLPFPTARLHSIWDVDTTNKALFVQDTITLDKVEIEMGLRYEHTDIKSMDATKATRDYRNLNGYVLTTYRPNEQTKYFVGLGKSSRVPDAKELYFQKPDGSVVGNASLEDTVNYELDIGAQKQFESGTIKGKLFYSKMKDYIAYNATDSAYENVDATLYGVELSGAYMVNELLSTEYGLSYQRGKKERALNGQTGTNLADIAPLKVNLALSYAYSDTLLLETTFISSLAWDRFDAENGEQKLDGYNVVNLKATKQFSDQLELTLGIDNLLDETYAVSNTYKDLTLLSTATSDVMLMNEPGRYLYANLRYKF